jgi:hypothetical protein
MSPAGKILLATYVASGAAVEELLWRAPVTWSTTRPRRRLLAVAGTAAFVLLHLRRDGCGTAPLHVLNGVAWTSSAALSGRVGWPIAGHAAYNWFAMSRRAAT